MMDGRPLQSLDERVAEFRGQMMSIVDQYRPPADNPARILHDRVTSLRGEADDHMEKAENFLGSARNHFDLATRKIALADNCAAMPAQWTKTETANG